MPQGDKSAYTDKQKRQARHIEEGYRDRGISEEESEARAWATVNKQSGGGKKSGSGRGHAQTSDSAKSAGGVGTARRTSEDRSQAAKKGWATRRKKAA